MTYNGRQLIAMSNIQRHTELFQLQSRADVFYFVLTARYRVMSIKKGELSKKLILIALNIPSLAD